MPEPIERNDIEAAADRIAGFVRWTPTIDLGRILSDDWKLILKLENLQVTGSFKVRGAFNVLLSARPEEVVAASGGNFGKAVAYAAERLSIPATIFVPASSPKEKTEAIARYGADVRVIDGYYYDALAASQEYAEATGHFVAHAYDQPEVMAGQGTVAYEIGRQVEGASTVLVAVGGGGLIGGTASWFRGEVDVIGVESELCPTLHTARAQGAPTEVEVGGIAASSLGARKLGTHPWTANQWIAGSVLVSDASTLAAQEWLWDQCRLWVEPASATTIAALREGHFKPSPGEAVVAVLSGANLGMGDDPAIRTPGY
ncbi:MAG: serine/threonine dehydratase [Acidimicrobiia bacterium]